MNWMIRMVRWCAKGSPCSRCGKYWREHPEIDAIEDWPEVLFNDACPSR